MANEFKFSTKQADKRGHLIDFGFRWYDPEIGRFTQRDPIGAAGGLNLYVYCGHNPANLTDPWGLTVGGYMDDMWNYGPENWEPPGCASQWRAPGRDEQKRGEGPDDPLSNFGRDISGGFNWAAGHLLDIADFAARLFSEPYDWFRTGVDWASGDFQWTDLIGLLPVLTPAMMRAADDAADALKASRRAARAADDAADAIKGGSRAARSAARYTDAQTEVIRRMKRMRKGATVDELKDLEKAVEKANEGAAMNVRLEWHPAHRGRGPHVKGHGGIHIDIVGGS